MNLLTEDEAVALMREKIKSRKHWVIPICSEQGSDMSAAIEKEYYLGTKNADFILVTGTAPFGLFAVAFADKRHMSVDDLIKLGVIPETPKSNQDVLLTPDLPSHVFLWMLKTFDGPYGE